VGLSSWCPTYHLAVATEDTHGLGYQRVDDDPNVPVLLAAMDGTAGWDSTRRLRSWERDQLRLTRGERLLDVGCGQGEAALVLAEDLGARGALVGIDVSEQMLRVARSNARSVRCHVRFTMGDACALDEPDGSFDAARSERTLQWVTDPAAAVAEMVRVLRPGGRLSLIDTDWSTFRIDVGDDSLVALVHDAMQTERARPSNVGGRLHGLVAAAGCEPLARAEATQVWTDWDPDESRAPVGCFSMESLADDLVARGRLTSAGRARFVSAIHDAARRGRFSMHLTMFAVVAAVP
jgi:SAM-dependent methyltransferase